eukprot:3352459-Prorocentrum_lima.AAC.1
MCIRDRPQAFRALLWTMSDRLRQSMMDVLKSTISTLHALLRVQCYSGPSREMNTFWPKSWAWPVYQMLVPTAAGMEVVVDGTLYDDKYKVLVRGNVVSIACAILDRDVVPKLRGELLT